MVKKQTILLNEVRILRIIARLNVGGPAIHVTLLTEGLNQSPFCSKLVTGQKGLQEGDMSYLAAERNIKPFYISELGREISFLDDIVALTKLIKLINSWRPHIVHTHTAKAGFLGRLAAFICGVPLIMHTFHGHAFRGYFGRLKTILFIWLERLSSLYTDYILTISETLRIDLAEFGVAPLEKITVIPLGLELENFAPEFNRKGVIKRELGLQDSDKLIGIIGRLVPIKKHKLFLLAVSELLKHRTDCHFVIVGDGELRTELEQFSHNLNLQDYVSFLGWRKDLGHIYADLDVLMLTSDNEGTPVSIIEAMAAGVPVVSTSVGGVPDLLQNGQLGRLVAPGNINQMVMAVLSTLQAPSPRQISEAQEFALAHYSSQRLISDLKAFYLKSLVAKGYDWVRTL